MAATTAQHPVDADLYIPPPVKHIRRPDNANVAYCGATKRPDGPRYHFHEADAADICAMCLSYPGAYEYARGC